MLPAERRKKMARIIQSKGAINTHDLALVLGVSTMTVRRDLKVLEEQNKLEIIWGGAVPPGFEANDIPRASKAASMREAKQAMARTAVSYIKDEDFLILDAGTSSLELARLLPTLPLNRLCVATPDLEIALLLADCTHIDVFVTGGRLNAVSRACTDADAVAYLRCLRATLAFIGTNVWDARHGVTVNSADRMRLKRQMAANADRCILLADSSKYARFSPWLVAGVERFDRIITDGGLGAEARATLKAAGARLDIAG